ncbi:1,2-phenylacetyl-CoA epoxidase subunit PaaD [Actinokineospora diospyrosa]|uniref:Ring-1,2-phenylacetyl-CoA epoxidase subunit PaaD n=1 Tax=Actinokineospora diospyrosa TaxID=103728 RepID=A0ABT1IEA4_9PSEU|nr:1,2-phenylacetyl-CoA epoxidase subunit PaaD [Actinokineospora diospyrosa]MCP2270969.1 ring-1,2-phenylacetyl-CoA epoxidase subunit PaaD [Actinokineospora diospyrosa]
MSTADLLAAVRAAVSAVPDPELRVLTLAELGILRGVSAGDDGGVVVTITPTYLGCPALEVIRADVLAAARAAGAEAVEVVTALSPPWTTDWVSDSARDKLTAVGIAPPPARSSLPLFVLSPGAPDSPQVVDGPPGVGSPHRTRPHRPACPRCRSVDTRELARFGSTACTALWRCLTCREPFDHVKEH